MYLETAKQYRSCDTQLLQATKGFYVQKLAFFKILS